MKKKKKKKKWDSYFWGVGLLLFIKRESQTPTFKILVRTLHEMLALSVIGDLGTSTGHDKKHQITGSLEMLTL